MATRPSDLLETEVDIRGILRDVQAGRPYRRNPKAVVRRRVIRAGTPENERLNRELDAPAITEYEHEDRNSGMTLADLVAGRDAQPRTDNATARWEGVKSGALFGGADEIEGFGGAVGNWLGRNGGDWLAPGVSFLTGRGYDSNATFQRGSGDFATDLERVRRGAAEERDRAWETNRSAFLQGYVPGVVISAGAPAGRLAQVSNPVARYGGMAGVGAAYGALQGGLSAEPGERLGGAGEGALIGAVAAPVLGRLVDNLVDDVPKAYRALVPGRGQQVADEFAPVAPPVAEDADLDRVLNTRPVPERIEYPAQPELGPLPDDGMRMPTTREIVAQRFEQGLDERGIARDNKARWAQKAENVEPAEDLGAGLSRIVREGSDPNAGVTETITFPDGKVVDVQTWDTDALQARMASERPDLMGTPTADTPADRLMAALGGAKTKVAEQEAARTAERGRRLREMGETRKITDGQSGFFSEKSSLKGALPKLTADDIREQFTQDDLNGLFDQLKNHKGFSFWDAINARNGLQRMLEGELPRPSELKLMEQVFKAPLIKQLMANRTAVKKAFAGEGGQAEMFTGEEILSSGPMRTLAPEPKPVDPDRFVDDPKQGDLFRDKPKARAPEPKARVNKATSTVKPSKELTTLANALNLPRALMATLDLSAPFRQGVFMVGRKQFWQSLPSMVKQFASPKAYQAVADEISSRPTADLMARAKLALTDTSGALSQREEEFMSDWAKRIPLAGIGVRASERAYSGFLNKLRADVFDDLVSKAERIGVDVDDDQWLKALGGYINNATGRGDLGRFNQAAPVLSGLFFSPRLMASRFNLMRPDYYVRLPNGVRQAAMRDLLTFGSIASTLVGLASFAGSDVELDPRSSDFAKIKVGKDGNTRYDILGGFGPYLTLAARLSAMTYNRIAPGKENDIGEVKTAAGELKKMGEGFGSPTGLDVTQKFFENKASPIASYVMTFMRNKNPVGEPFNFTKDTLNLFVPMLLNDFKEVMAEEGNLKGAAMAVPSIFGIGIGSYSVLGAAPVSVKMDGEEIELDSEDREKYAGVARAYLDESLNALKADGTWEQMSEADRTEVTKQIVQDARKEAKESLFEMPEEEAPAETEEIADAVDEEPDLLNVVWEPGSNPLDFPFGIPTSGRRTVEGNRLVRGVSNSAHLSGDGVDFVPAPGVSWEALIAEAQRYFGPDAEVIFEGDHVHVEKEGLDAPYFGKRGTA